MYKWISREGYALQFSDACRTRWEETILTNLISSQKKEYIKVGEWALLEKRKVVKQTLEIKTLFNNGKKKKEKVKEEKVEEGKQK